MLAADSYYRGRDRDGPDFGNANGDIGMAGPVSMETDIGRRCIPDGRTVNIPELQDDARLNAEVLYLENSGVANSGLENLREDVPVFGCNNTVQTSEHCSINQNGNSDIESIKNSFSGPSTLATQISGRSIRGGQSNASGYRNFICSDGGELEPGGSAKTLSPLVQNDSTAMGQSRGVCATSLRRKIPQ